MATKPASRDMIATKDLKRELRNHMMVVEGQAMGAISLAYLRGESDGIKLAARYLRENNETAAFQKLVKRFG